MTVGEVSIYRNIYDKTSKFKIGVIDALDRIKTGKSQKRIIDLRTEADENRQSYLKEQLPSVTWSGVFETRVDSALLQHSGFICLDFDKVNVEETKDTLKKWTHTYACWVSPRGNGVKVLVRISNPEKHREHFLALREIWKNIDEKCINVSRVCYESFDPEIYINEDAKVFSKYQVKEIVTEKTINTDTYAIFKNLQKWLEKKNEAFTSGNRNEYVFKLSGSMCRYGVNEFECADILKSEYVESTFKHTEIERTVRSAYNQNKDKFGTVEFSDEKLVEKKTTIQVDPAVFIDGVKPKDVIYGADVYEEALDIYNNGYRTAESTHIKSLDEYFKFKRGELTLLGGVGNFGKTQYLNFLMLVKSYFDGTKWATFCPENYPAAEFFLDLTEALLGCRCDGGNPNRPPQKYFDKAYQFISEHFFYVYPESISPTPEYIKTKFMELIIKEKIDGVVIDPFNQLTNDYKTTGGRDDKYLDTFLSDCKRFAQENNIYFFIISHPNKMVKGADGNYPCVDVFDLAGGAMWNNKMDNILTYHRPYAITDPENPVCEHHSKKIRRQKMIGKKGQLDFMFDRKQRRFIFNGENPLNGNIYEFKTNGQLIDEQDELAPF